MTRGVGGGVALVALVLALPACGDSAGPEPQSREVAWAAAYQGLCEATATAQTGDIAAANGIFLAKSHVALHDLASAGSEGERAAAARLLEAKADVEESLALSSLSSADALAELQRRTAELISAVATGPSPDCGRKEGSE